MESITTTIYSLTGGKNVKRISDLFDKVLKERRKERYRLWLGHYLEEMGLNPSDSYCKGTICESFELFEEKDFKQFVFCIDSPTDIVGLVNRAIKENFPNVCIKYQSMNATDKTFVTNDRERDTFSEKYYIILGDYDYECISEDEVIEVYNRIMHTDYTDFAKVREVINGNERCSIVDVTIV